MSDFNSLGLGQTNATGDRTALMLKLFGGETLSVFNDTQVMMDKQMIRNISGGKSAQFPVFGLATAEYHTPGVELLGGTIRGGERIIYIDKRLIAHVGVDELEEKMAHYDVRSIYSRQMGEALANKFDENSQIVLALAARVAADVAFTGAPAGNSVTSSTSKTDADALGTALFSAAQKLDEKNVSQMGRYAAMKPAQFWLLVGGTKALNRDWGGIGSYAKGTLPEVAGLSLVKTNNLAATTVASDTSNRIDGVSAGNTYHGDFQYNAAMVWQRDAIGTVKLKDITPSTDWIAKNRIWLLAAEGAMGTGILRPECACEIVTQ